ncbi:hypothetical protein F4780DRAFT_660181 [Xylariomycetidae sp. FL0641]|nr:hypothetical protein F4780DRAFT_660181 [Xylariomycetidae sp. FL0641]
MLLTQSFLALLGSASSVVSAAALAVEKRAPEGPFALYAYGEGIGGHPVISSGDVAYVGNVSRLQSDEVAPVLFTIGDNDSLSANPNTTAGDSAPSWSDRTMFVPGPSASSHTVGFLNRTAAANESTTGFVFYGQMAMHQDAKGMHTRWYALPTEHKDLWTLEWDLSDSVPDCVSVGLRATPPSRLWF